MPIINVLYPTSNLYPGSTLYPHGKLCNKVTLRGETLIDLTADTVTSGDVLNGKTFHLASGEKVTGSAQLQEKTVTVTSNGTQTVNPDDGNAGISAVTIVTDVPNPSSGNIDITGTSPVDVTNYATAQVVDSDLAAGNIKAGVNILGITGTYSQKNVQYSAVMGRITSSSYTATGAKITVAKTGTYKCSWTHYASASSSSYYLSRLYKNSSAVGSTHACPAYSDTSGWIATENSISLNAGDTIEVRARARSSSYYTVAGLLVIEEV